MPAKGQHNPESLPSKIREWFAEHPGMHRCQDVAHSLGYDRTWPVANECGRLWREGQLSRTRVPVEGRRKPITYYAAPDEARRNPRKDSDASRPAEEDRQEGASPLGTA